MGFVLRGDLFDGTQQQPLVNGREWILPQHASGVKKGMLNVSTTTHIRQVALPAIVLFDNARAPERFRLTRFLPDFSQRLFVHVSHSELGYADKGGRGIDSAVCVHAKATHTRDGQIHLHTAPALHTFPSHFEVVQFHAAGSGALEVVVECLYDLVCGRGLHLLVVDCTSLFVIPQQVMTPDSDVAEESGEPTQRIDVRSGHDSGDRGLKSGFKKRTGSFEGPFESGSTDRVVRGGIRAIDADLQAEAPTRDIFQPFQGGRAEEHGIGEDHKFAVATDSSDNVQQVRAHKRLPSGDVELSDAELFRFFHDAQPPIA